MSVFVSSPQHINQIFLWYFGLFPHISHADVPSLELFTIEPLKFLLSVLHTDVVMEQSI